MDLSKLKKHLAALKKSEERLNAEDNWQAGADFCNPPNDNITRITSKGSRKTVARVTDVGIKARRKFASNMYGYKIGGSRFFEYRVKDRALRDNENVKRWMNDVNNITYTEIMSSNFPNQVHLGYSELSYIGTTAMFIEGGNDRALNFKTQNIAKTYIDVDSKGMVDTVFMELPFTARQIEQEFENADMPDKVKAALDRGSMEEFCVIHAVVRNPDYKKGSLNPKKRRWAGVYLFEDGSEMKQLRFDGYDELPVAVGRLHRAYGEIYGRGCFTEVWSSLNLNNDQNVSLIRSAQLKAEPPMLEPSGSNIRFMKSRGISKFVYDPTATFGAQPQQLVVNNDVGITDAMIEKTEKEILDAFFVNAFNPLLDVPREITATESMQRTDLGLSEVSPLLYSLREYDNAIMHRVFGILLRNDYYPEPPAELDGLDASEILDVEYISKAALALKQMQLYGLNATIEQMGMVGQVKPEIWDNFDGDAYARFTADTNNVPNEVLLPSADVQKIRAARAQQMQQQQMMQNAPLLADAANKISKDVEPNSPLAQMMEG